MIARYRKMKTQMQLAVRRNMDKVFSIIIIIIVINIIIIIIIYILF